MRTIGNVRDLVDSLILDGGKLTLPPGEFVVTQTLNLGQLALEGFSDLAEGTAHRAFDDDALNVARSDSLNQPQVAPTTKIG